MTAADALLALQAAVETATCSSCRCDTDSSGAVVASDAARILSASVGLPVALGCPACNSLHVDVSEEGKTVGASADDVAAVANGGVVAAWVEGDTVMARGFDASLDPTGPPVAMASSTDAMFYLHACGRRNGSIAVAWESETPHTFPPPHDYDDTGNARAAQRDSEGLATGAVDLHAPAAGWQTPLGLSCRPGGRLTAIWRSSCIGHREYAEGASTSYTPQDCPQNGVWFRRFEADGSPAADAKLVVSTYSQWYLWWEAAVELPDGGFVLAQNNRLVVLNAYGEMQADTTMPSPSHLRVRHDCGAGAHRCVAVNDAYSLQARVYAVAEPDKRLGTVVRPTESSWEPPYEITIRASSPVVACDADGICLVAWYLVRDEENWDEDYYDTTTLGIFARAFNAHTGELGPEVSLASTDILSLAPGRFVVVERDVQEETVLRPVAVR